MLAVAQTSFAGLEPEPALDDVLEGLWRGLGAHHTVECPVCHGAMTPQYGAQALPIGGRCTDCGTTLR